jgi:alpha-2-macroglobulin
MTGNVRDFLLWTAGILILLVLLIAPVAADTMVRQENTDHDGDDYTTLFPGTSTYNGTPESCMENCLGQPECNAATFASRDQSCWLKKTVPVATQRTGVISFVRQKEGAAGPVTSSATQAGIAAPAGSPAPAATKKSPGFGWAAAVSGCLGVLVILRKAV